MRTVGLPYPVKIVAHTGGMVQTNCYLVADEEAKTCVLFDAPDHTVAPLLRHVAEAGWHLQGLWLTHGHFDHLADHAVVRGQHADAGLLIHPADEPMLSAPQATLFSLPFDIPPAQASGHLEDGQVLHIGNIPVEVLHTPGHSPGHVCFYLPKHGVLIGGDLILMHAIGRVDLPGGDLPTLLNSLRRVMQLPPETTILAGHGGASTLAEERRLNPYVAEALAD